MKVIKLRESLAALSI